MSNHLMTDDELKNRIQDLLKQVLFEEITQDYYKECVFDLFKSQQKAYADAHAVESEKNGIAWAIKEIDDMHFNAGDGVFELDKIFKGIKNSLRDRAKLQAGYDPAPTYPINATLRQRNKKK